jgi:hypothetical protein
MDRVARLIERDELVWIGRVCCGKIDDAVANLRAQSRVLSLYLFALLFLDQNVEVQVRVRVQFPRANDPDKSPT